MDIHAGFYPAGVGDLDRDGDPDIFPADRWMENLSAGKQWAAHRVLFGRRGPWGFSTRSAILDVDGDGDNDIVVADSDGQNSGVAWLESNGKTPPEFTPHYLGNKAPGTRGSLHSVRVADFDADGDQDILAIGQADPSILPVGAAPRWYIWENVGMVALSAFEERVILDNRLAATTPGRATWTVTATSTSSQKSGVSGAKTETPVASTWTGWRIDPADPARACGTCHSFDPNRVRGDRRRDASCFPAGMDGPPASPIGHIDGNQTAPRGMEM